jgi:hypothetical protein
MHILKNEEIKNAQFIGHGILQVIVISTPPQKWDKIGIQMSELPHKTDHPYKAGLYNILFYSQ